MLSLFMRFILSVITRTTVIRAEVSVKLHQRASNEMSADDWQQKMLALLSHHPRLVFLFHTSLASAHN